MRSACRSPRCARKGAGARRQTSFWPTSGGREIDVHPVEFDRRGYGCFELPDGRRWPFPPAALTDRGRVGERQVSCLSVDAQVQCHGQGNEPSEKDLRDMERLQERFGVVLPIHLCRR
jgi:lincosamide nucleotidyltransferase A/C/D/E